MRRMLALAVLLFSTCVATAADPVSATRTRSFKEIPSRNETFRVTIVDTERLLRAQPTLGNQLRLAWHRMTRLPRQTVAISVLGISAGAIRNNAVWGTPKGDTVSVGPYSVEDEMRNRIISRLHTRSKQPKMPTLETLQGAFDRVQKATERAEGAIGP